MRALLGKLRVGIALLALSPLMLATDALAADDIPTPGSVRQTLPPDEVPRFAPPSQVVFPVQPGPAQFDQDGERFIVNAFEFPGATAFSQQRLKRVVERFVDMELNLFDLNRAADDISRYYQDRGFALARAYVPAQVVKDGVVRIDVVEGRIGRVQFFGNRRYDAAFLGKRLPNMAPGTLVTTERLESDLLRLNELPGVDARVVLSPGAEAGSTDAAVQIEEPLIGGSVALNNFGRRDTGQNRAEIAVNLNAPFGWGDRLAWSGVATQQSLVRYWKMGYDFPVTAEGLRLALNVSHTAYDVAGKLADLGIAGDMKSEQIDLIAPLKRTRMDSRTLTLGLKRSRSVQSALGTPVLEGELKLFAAAYTASFVNGDASFTQLAFKFDGNFRKNKNGTDQDKQFGRYEIDANHVAPFSERWDLYLRGNVVFSRETLPDAEKFSLGGPASVRGFRPSEVRGDTGWLTTVEMRHPFQVAGLMGQARVFGDSGKVVYKLPGYKDSTDALNSVGVGATLFIGKRFSAAADFAAPTSSTRKSGDGRGNRVWMSVNASF